MPTSEKCLILLLLVSALSAGLGNPAGQKKQGGGDMKGQSHAGVSGKPQSDCLLEHHAPAAPLTLRSLVTS